MLKSVCLNPNHKIIVSLVDFVVRLMQHCGNLFNYINVEAVDVMKEFLMLFEKLNGFKKKYF